MCQRDQYVLSLCVLCYFTVVDRSLFFFFWKFNDNDNRLLIPKNLTLFALYEILPATMSSLLS